LASFLATFAKTHLVTLMAGLFWLVGCHKRAKTKTRKKRSETMLLQMIFVFRPSLFLNSNFFFRANS
jgi:hypothetical protein